MKTKVAVIFGGVSVEHEVSVISALQAFNAIDRAKYDPVPIYISKTKEWYTGDVLTNIDNYKNLDQLFKDADKVVLEQESEGNIVLKKKERSLFSKGVITTIDVVFPVIHGTNGEDGSLQGYLELLGLPYVGCDVASSASGMDKVMMKQILRDSGVPIVDYQWFYSNQWHDNQEEIKQLAEKVGYPVIVKPANLGSSVGISKAANEAELEEAIELAISYSFKVVIEKMVTDLTEINCSVIGDYEEVESSVCEQVLSTDEILSYADKYQSGGKTGDTKGMESVNRIIPANINEEQTEKVKELAERTFRLLNASGVSRIDFLLNPEGDVFVNEINTIPGSLSFYLWEPSGKDFEQLTDQLIQLALKRERERQSIQFSIDTNLFSLHSKGQGTKGK
ncbi:D-alanine--D-alanine ligase family protein [Gracilibacillus sp. S3-1-1]|uniref:D-alanine--D-alanine ligase family protein n=1 Tax=Gracilibacillus pellucidus TaxID=3095368 RepID=A0ACC6M960_9BACI|nr:D-alanine--D-alanine ligase family protein [Gracilibacillus sp. S3-1-1]MDX8047423.1 D-alanine--D-alanine ligase family protein [Gracilibacillus sp. S3-1-1]